MPTPEERAYEVRGIKLHGPLAERDGESLHGKDLGDGTDALQQAAVLMHEVAERSGEKLPLCDIYFEMVEVSKRGTDGEELLYACISVTHGKLFLTVLTA